MAHSTANREETVTISGELGDMASRLGELGIVTKKQAEAWLLVKVEGWEQRRAAEVLGISEASLSERLKAARRNLDAAETTVNMMDEHRD